MKEKTSTLEVLDVEELPLEEKIEHALVKENITDKVINSLKEKYSNLRLKSLDDKEGYLEIKESRKEVRKVGILVEKICLAGRTEANRIQKLWIEKEKEVSNKILAIQSPLDAEIKKFDDEVERKENAEKERKESAYQQRQATLIKYGAAYNNGSFELNHISYEIDNIREADEEIWNDIILPKYKVEFEKIEAERVIIEKEREAAAFKLKEEQAELLRQREEMEAMKRELAAEQLRMQKIKDDAEREQRERERKIADAEIKERREKISKRCNQLTALGLVYNIQHDSYVFEDVAVSRIVEIERMDDATWDEMLSKITPTIERCKKEIESKRIADALEQKEKDIEAALQKEREWVAEVERLEELRIKQQEQKEAEELEKASDRIKWNHFLTALSAIKYPEMKSRIYKSKIAQAKEKNEEVINL